MRLICSLTGCDWGEKMVERETDDRGDEVVVTEVEFQLCSRCGSRRTTGENKEVRSKTEEESEEADEPPDVEYENPDETEDAVFVDGSEADEPAEGEVKTAAPGRSSGSRGSATSDDASYRCPDCGYSSGEESFREGDVCPECGGYLESL